MKVNLIIFNHTALITLHIVADSKHVHKKLSVRTVTWSSADRHTKTAEWWQQRHGHRVSGTCCYISVLKLMERHENRCSAVKTWRRTKFPMSPAERQTRCLCLDLLIKREIVQDQSAWQPAWYQQNKDILEHDKPCSVEVIDTTLSVLFQAFQEGKEKKWDDKESQH